MHILMSLVGAGVLGSFVRAEGLPSPSALACAARLLDEVTKPASRVAPIYFRRRPARVTPEPVTGARPLTIDHAGAWVLVPVNAVFARETYTSLFEIQT